MDDEVVLIQWSEGETRLRERNSDGAWIGERVVNQIVSELRRRLGGAFTVSELVQLYNQGTDWCQDTAFAAAPSDPEAWDSQVVVDAAFNRYLREATDFAGGVRLTKQPDG